MSDFHRQASLLGLPPELRLRIYSFAFSGSEQCYVKVSGTLSDLPGQSLERIIVTNHGPWALSMTCRELAAEVKDILPAIEDVHFDFDNLTHSEMKHWLFTMGGKRVSQIRDLEMHGWGVCRSEMYQEFHDVQGSTLEQHTRVGEHSDCALDVERETLAPGSTMWLEYLGFCQRSCEYRLKDIETLLQDQGMIEDWREDGNEDDEDADLGALDEAVEDFLRTEGAYDVEDCNLRHGCVHNADCSEAREEIAQAARSGMVGADGKLKMDAERILRLYGVIADQDACEPLIVESVWKVWEDYLAGLQGSNAV